MQARFDLGGGFAADAAVDDFDRSPVVGVVGFPLSAARLAEDDDARLGLGAAQQFGVGGGAALGIDGVESDFGDAGLEGLGLLEEEGVAGEGGEQGHEQQDDQEAGHGGLGWHGFV